MNSRSRTAEFIAGQHNTPTFSAGINSRNNRKIHSRNSIADQQFLQELTSGNNRKLIAETA
jgi:hypothetical protein